ncbi:MAG: lysozyme [Dongiaceae bacterium]
MNLGPRGLALIKRFESLRLDAYRDSGGVWTIGYGHTGQVKPDDQVTEVRAEALLKSDVAGAESVVNRLILVPLNQSQFDALASLVFNIGGAAFATSTLRRRVHSNDHLTVPTEFCKWRHDNGVPLLGLLRRRVAEAALYLEDL